MIKKRSIGKSDQRLKSPIRSHYTYMCFTSVCYGDIHSGSKGGGSAPKRCRSTQKLIISIYDWTSFACSWYFLLQHEKMCYETSVVLWSMEAFPPRRAAVLSFRSVLFWLLPLYVLFYCGVGLYCFANKPWFYVSAVYCCCGQRRAKLRGWKTISKRQ